MEPRKPIKVDDTKLIALWSSRLPDKVLAAKMGHGRAVLHRRARALGLPYRRSIWAKELDNE